MNATRIDRGSTATTTIYSEDAELVFERTFNAPREQVWKALRDDEAIPESALQDTAGKDSPAPGVVASKPAG